MQNNIPESMVRKVKDLAKLEGDHTDEEITAWIDEVITYLKRNGISGMKIGLSAMSWGTIGLIAKGVEDLCNKGGLSREFRFSMYELEYGTF